jgi:hypothetical protein
MPWSDQRWPLSSVCPVSSAAVPRNGTGVPVWCNWQYVHCDSSSKSVVSFEAARYGSSYGSYLPQATLPSAFGSLPNLQRIKLTGANLNGTIPSVLGSLSQLTLLDLSYNQLTGAIPPLSMPFVSLRSGYSGGDSIQLGLASNYLAGTVPPFVSNLAFTYLGRQLLQFTVGNNCDLQSTIPVIRDSLAGQGHCPPPANVKGKDGLRLIDVSCIVFNAFSKYPVSFFPALSSLQRPSLVKVSPFAKWPEPWSHLASRSRNGR